VRGGVKRSQPSSRIKRILCVTADSVNAPWLNFEAGALWKATDRSRVIPYLHGIEMTDITGPLPALFQMTIADHDDTRRMLSTLNLALGADSALPESKLDKAFETHWPELKRRLATIPQHDAEPKRRDTYDILTEILTHVRALNASSETGYTGAEAIKAELFRRLLEQARERRRTTRHWLSSLDEAGQRSRSAGELLVAAVQGIDAQRTAAEEAAVWG